MAVYLALYRAPGDWSDRIIRWWTGGTYSHCELVVDGVCYSSSIRDGGVRSKTINLGESWDLTPLPDHFAKDITRLYQETQGHRYSWWNLVTSQIFNTGADAPGSAFCSEWCARALGIPNPTTLNPTALAGLVDYLKDNHRDWADDQ